MRVTVQNFIGRLAVPILLAVVIGSIFAVPRAVAALELQGQPAQATAQEGSGGEVNLIVPDLSQVEFRGFNGRSLLMAS